MKSDRKILAQGILEKSTLEFLKENIIYMNNAKFSKK